VSLHFYLTKLSEQEDLDSPAFTTGNSPLLRALKQRSSRDKNMNYSTNEFSSGSPSSEY